MKIVEVSSGQLKGIEITPLDDADYDTIHTLRYYFDWIEERSHDVVKLTLAGSTDILGLMSLECIDSEKRIHIRLLAASRENVGDDKEYDGIVGNLLAFAARTAVLKFAEWACISLRPKTEVARHYMDKYKMNLTDVTLSLEVPEILELIEKYSYEE